MHRCADSRPRLSGSMGRGHPRPGGDTIGTGARGKSSSRYGSKWRSSTGDLPGGTADALRSIDVLAFAFVVPTEGRSLLSSDSATTLSRSDRCPRNHPRLGQQRFQPAPERPPLLKLIFLRMLREISRRGSGHSLFSLISSPFRGQCFRPLSQTWNPSRCRRSKNVYEFRHSMAARFSRPPVRKKGCFLRIISMVIDLIYRHPSI